MVLRAVLVVGLLWLCCHVGAAEPVHAAPAAPAAQSEPTTGTKPDTVLVNALLQEGLQAEQVAEWDRVLRVAGRAEGLAKALDYHRGLAEALRLQARALYRLERPTAYQYFQRAYLLAERLGDVRAQGSICNQLGHMFLRSYRYAIAQQYYERAIQLRSAAADSEGVGSSYHNLALIQWRLGDAEKAQHYFDISRRYDHLSPRLRAANLSEQGLMQLELNHVEIAQAMFEECLRELGNVDIERKVMCLDGLARLAALRGDKQSAETLLREALAHTHNPTNTNRYALVTANLAYVSHKIRNEDWAAARNYALEAEQLCLAIRFYSGLETVYGHLLKIYQQLGQYPEAAAFASKQNTLQDTLRAHAMQAELQEIRNQTVQKNQAVPGLLFGPGDALGHSTWLWGLCAIMALCTGSVVTWAVLRTQRQRAVQAELAQQTARLRSSLDECQQQLTKLQQSDKMKNEFLGIAAHDLKNPIAAISIYANLIRDKTVERMTEKEKRDYAMHIQNAADQMMGIVSNLLDINRIEQGKMLLRMMPLDPAHILSRVLGAYTLRITEKRLQLHTTIEDPLPYIRADEFSMHQVLDNLLSNAVKFSPLGKNIYVKAYSTDSHVYIEIKDEGPGISEEDFAKLFGMFARLSARPTGGESSTGLGLSIVKRLTELMNGRVSCHSHLGMGAVFTVEFPISIPEEEPEEEGLRFSRLRAASA